ncbi:MAG: hypothetical protein ABI658_29050 [Acidimicrobiales bacterium]
MAAELMERADRAQWSFVKDGLVWQPTKIHLSDVSGSLTDFVNNPDRSRATVAGWRLRPDAFDNARGLSAGATWWLQSRPSPICVRCRAAELAIFSTGVGFVSLDFIPRQSPRESDMSSLAPDRVSTWVELSHDLRYLGGVQSRPLVVERRTGGAPHSKQSCFAAFDTSAPVATGDEGRLHHLIDGLLSTLSPSPPADGVRVASPPVELRLRSRSHAFVSLFLVSAADRQIRETVLRLRANARSGADFVPSEKDLRLDGEGVYLRAESAWHYMSQTTAGFVGNDLPERGYFAQVPNEFRHQYQLGLLFALQQRYALLGLAERVSDEWLEPDESDRVAAFRAIQDDLHHLMARGMPSELLERDGQQRFYAFAQRELRVPELFGDVRTSVAELNDAVRLRFSEALQDRQHRFEQRVSIFALLFGVPSLALAFLGVNIRGVTAPDAIPLWFALAFLVFAFCLGALIGRAIRGSQQ